MARPMPRRRTLSIKEVFKTVFGPNAKFYDLSWMVPIVDESVTNMEYAS